MSASTPSDDSSEDFYNMDASASEALPGTAPTASSAAVNASDTGVVVQSLTQGSDLPKGAISSPEHGPNDATGDGSSVDMDLSEPSPPATPEPVCDPATLVPQKDVNANASAAAESTATNHAGAKRKLSDAVDGTNNGFHSDLPGDNSKKRRLTPEIKNAASNYTPPMSVPIWQRIFTYLPPAMLCRCLRVSKDFNHILTGVKPPPVKPKDRSIARVMDSEAIWTQARKTFFPQLPRPLARCSELDMLKLVGGQTCQLCGKTGIPPPATSVYNCGPGYNGVRVIFAFAVRTCGLCIDPYLRRDVQLLGDKALAQLRLGTPHAFRNSDHHFVSETIRQTPQGIPGAMRFSKVYYQAELDAIKREEEEALQLGQGAVDEWRKGLFTKGKDIMADAARWEKWEASLPLGSNLAQVLREYDLASFPRHVQHTHSRSTAGVNGSQLPTAVNGKQRSPLLSYCDFLSDVVMSAIFGLHEFTRPTSFSSHRTLTKGDGKLPELDPDAVDLGTPHPLPQPVHVFPAQYGHPPQPHQMPPFPPPGFPPTGYPPPFPLPLPPHQQQAARNVRNAQEVEIARQARKAEIERRCKELEPPVEPNVLQHMESFQAAMQITTPLTDAAWDILKPRILAQRESAELAEHARASQLAALRASIPSGAVDDLIPKPAKETYDREYEDAQTPLRRRLEEYADDLINGQWVGGRTLDSINAPIFAIKVLQHVRQRYVQDKELGLLPRFEAPQAKRGQDPPLEPFLSLDNMKWVYDNKVRPLTDVHCKEHFLCAGCKVDKKAKWFAFEGLIQHYGAKHTSSFSKGNIIVHWQTAEWPEQEPFHDNPKPWIKTDRSVPDYKSQDRHHNIPRSSHEGGHQAPVAHYQSHIAYSPSNGHGARAPGYPNGRNGHPTTHVYQASHNGHPAAIIPANLHSNGVGSFDVGADHDAQVRQLSSVARDTWDALDGVKDLLACIKVHTALHHSVAKFFEQFHFKPALDLLTDALATNNTMRPLKNAGSLACKVCVAAGQNGTSTSYWTRIRGVKLQTTSNLITHFKLAHESLSDWTSDMVEIPDQQIVKELLRTPGMDDAKLCLIAAAFPGVFTTPLPKIGTLDEHGQSGSADSGPTSLLDRLSKKGSKPKKKGQKSANGGHGQDGSQEPLPEAKEDEYDPLRPALVASKTWDPAQFDTDARKSSIPAQPAQPAQSVLASGNVFSLAPATLAALQKLNPSSAQAQDAHPGGRQSRSPSVGCAHSSSRPAGPATAMPPAKVVTPTGEPDIAAILASLTGQPQQVTPPTSAEHRSSSAARLSQAPTYGVPAYQPSPVYQDEARRFSPRYEGTYQVPPGSASAFGVPDTHSSLAYNSRQYEQNQQPAYTERPYAAPPRYMHSYQDDRQYAQPPAHTTLYRDPPRQYVQVAQRGQEYPYYQPAPPLTYVDQDGTLLIPVDPAAAPSQYAVHPYEQQQYARRSEPQVYGAVPQQHLQQPVYDQARPVYYEHPPPQSAHGIPPRYAYDDGRASVPRS